LMLQELVLLLYRGVAHEH